MGKEQGKKEGKEEEKAGASQAQQPPGVQRQGAGAGRKKHAAL
jgi:hypothetical protein